MPGPLRAVVVGTSASGKSTFARHLARLVAAPYVELDELNWAPNWQEKPAAEFARLVAQAAAGDSWIVDGNYARIRDTLWPRANLIVWLNYGFALTFWRGLRRSTARALTGEVLWHGNRESLRRLFLSKDSMLVWIATTHGRRAREFAALRASARFPRLTWVEFRRPAEAARWLAEIERSGRAAGASG